MTVRVSKPAFNIREKVSELDKPTGLKGSELMRSDTSQDARNLIGVGRKNLIINGSMQVAQRGTSDTSTDYFSTVDRWNFTANGQEENLTRAQESLSSSDTGPYEKGFRNAWKITNGNQTGGADTGGYVIPQYAIEAQDLANSGWDYKSASSYITLSFWVKSSVAQTFYGFLRTIAGTDQAWSFNYTLSANTWTKVTKTIPGLSNGNIDINDDNTNGMSIFLPIFLGTDRTDSSNVEETWAAYNGSNRTKPSISGWYTTNDATWHLTGVQLEVGSEATEFEHRSIGEEIELCRRYYSVFHPTGQEQVYIESSGVASHSFVNFPVPYGMRTEPSVTLGGTWTGHGIVSGRSISAVAVQTIDNGGLNGTTHVGSMGRCSCRVTRDSSGTYTSGQIAHTDGWDDGVAWLAYDAEI